MIYLMTYRQLTKSKKNKKDILLQCKRMSFLSSNKALINLQITALQVKNLEIRIK